MALRTQQPGRAVVLKDGTYNIASIEPLRIDSPRVSIRGMSGNPTAIVLVGKGFENCDDVEEEMLQLYGTDVLLADFTISECRCNCVKFQSGANNNTVFHNVHFLNVGERMIKHPNVPFSESCTLRHCHFENTKIPSASRCGSNSLDQDGNYIAGIDIMYGRNWVIHDNVFLNIKGSSGGGRGAIFLWGMSENMVSERNTIAGCDRSICYGNPGGSYVIGGIIRNNFINRGAGQAMEICQSSNIQTFNNTVYSTVPTYSLAISYYQPGGGNEFKNNIVFGNLYRNGGAVVDTARNLIRTTMQNWFISPATNDLHLNAFATAAVNSGLANLVTDDWNGHCRAATDALTDIGADEYNSVVVQCPGPAIETNSDMSAGNIKITAMPNPFNSAVTITVEDVNGQQAVKRENARIDIFTIHGKHVQSLPVARPALGGLSASFIWDASAQPSGAYIIRVIIEEKILVKQIIFMK
ncbi:MAG: hypothetical protein A2350_09155 [Candidatus Raymondbacteria bacterium RifOxyB12_full_50_8]|nr:MAG: hypothetical protein A2350_09155 [Candidatus Raymondbacteria bacterium RifOxyB12_full_50_8]